MSVAARQFPGEWSPNPLAGTSPTITKTPSLSPSATSSVVRTLGLDEGASPCFPSTFFGEGVNSTIAATQDSQECMLERCLIRDERRGLFDEWTVKEDCLNMFQSLDGLPTTTTTPTASESASDLFTSTTIPTVTVPTPTLSETASSFMKDFMRVAETETETETKAEEGYSGKK